MSSEAINRPPTPFGNPHVRLVDFFNGLSTDANVHKPHDKVPASIQTMGHLSFSDRGSVTTLTLKKVAPAWADSGMPPKALRRAPSLTTDRHLVSLLRQLHEERARHLSQLSFEQHANFLHQNHANNNTTGGIRPLGIAGDLTGFSYVPPTSQQLIENARHNLLDQSGNGYRTFSKCHLKEGIMAGSSNLPHATMLPRSPTEHSSSRNARHGMELPSDEHKDFDLASVCQEDWPGERVLWRSLPATFGMADIGGLSHGLAECDPTMDMSLGAGMSASYYGPRRPPAHRLSTKVEMVYSLLSMLGTHDKKDLSRTLLTMSGSRESCIAMRQSGCLPLLIQLLHGGAQQQESTTQPEAERIAEQRQAIRELRSRAGQALHNVVHAHPDDKRGRREARVLRLLEQIRDYCDYLRDVEAGTVEPSHSETGDQHPGPAIAALMKLSFDEEHRHAMCQLGGLQAIAELIQVDHKSHGSTSDHYCVTLRRYAGMALTNLTFGDGTNKALLCSMKPFMQALVVQLHSPSEDLRQVTASVLRNLSWRADSVSRETLRDVGAVPLLMKASMEANKESTLKSILSALWNLSAHCTSNKVDICGVDGALAFLVSTLTYRSQSKTLAIVENGGGILRNISSYIALHEEHRAVLRKHNCLQVLLQQLSSPSLTVVSNACGTLWNLSAHCVEDQIALWQMGAVGMLRNLVNSKHRMISMGSSAALKNLLSARHTLKLEVSAGDCDGRNNNNDDDNGNDNLPSLLFRKQRTLEADIDDTLAETCDNIDSPRTSPTLEHRFVFGDAPQHEALDQSRSYLPGRMYHSVSGVSVPRSDSRDSIGSTHSEPTHFRPPRSIFSCHRLVRYSFDRYGRVEWHPSNRGRDISAFGMNLNLTIASHSDVTSAKEHRKVDSGNEAGMPYYQNSHSESFQQKHRAREEGDGIGTHLIKFEDVREADNEDDLGDGSSHSGKLSRYGEVTVSRDHPGGNRRQSSGFGTRGCDAEGRERLFQSRLDGLVRKSTHDKYGEDTVFLTDLASLEDDTEPVDENTSKLKEMESEEKEENDGGSASDEYIPDTDAALTAASKECIESSSTQGNFSKPLSNASSSVALHHKVSGIPVKCAAQRISRGRSTPPLSTVLVQQRQAFSAYTEGKEASHSISSTWSSSLRCHSAVDMAESAAHQQTEWALGQHSVAHSLPAQWIQEQHMHNAGSDAAYPPDTPQAQSAGPKRPVTHCCGFSRSVPAPSLHEYIFGKKKAKHPVPVKPVPQPQQYDAELHQCAETAHTTAPFVTTSDNNVGEGNFPSQRIPVPSVSTFASPATACKQSLLLRHSLVHEEAVQVHSHPVVTVSEETPVPARMVVDVSASVRSRSTSTEGSDSGRSGSCSPNRSMASVREKIRSGQQTNPWHGGGGESKLRKTESNMGMTGIGQLQQQRQTDCEEKGKEDERAKEKTHQEEVCSGMQQNIIDVESFFTPDVTSNVPLSSNQAASCFVSVGNPPLHEVPQDICKDHPETSRRVSETRAQKATGTRMAGPIEDEMVRSTTSCISDLENTKSPSLMGDLLSMSMTSSGLSDNVSSAGKNGKSSVSRKSRLPRRMRPTFGSGMQESPRSCTDSDLLEFVGPPSAMGSIESLSFHSNNGHSEDLHCVNPPSTMDELSLSGSYTSLNSISSNEDHSSPIETAASKVKPGSKMSERLNAAANLAHIYSRELNSIMNGSMRSSSGTSEMLEHVQPPSIYHDIHEVTYEDITELGSDGFLSDIEFDDDLPKDEDIPMPSTETLQVPQVSSLMRQEHLGDSTENLVSTCVEDTEALEPDEEPITHEPLLVEHDRTFMFDVSPEVSKEELERATLKEIQQFSGGVCTGDCKLEDETFSLISNESDFENPEEMLEIVEQTVNDTEKKESKPLPLKGPRIIKPLNRDAIKQIQEKKGAEKAVQHRGIRGKGCFPQPLQLRRTGSLTPSQSPSPTASPIKHTKASALRASQNQRSSSAGSKASKSISAQKFVWTAPNSPGGQSSATKVSVQNSAVISRLATASGNSNGKPSPRPKSLESVDTKMHDNVKPDPPPPLVRQGTFTKESPTGSVQDIATKSSGNTPLAPKPSHSSVHAPSIRAMGEQDSKSANSNLALRRTAGKSSSASSTRWFSIINGHKRKTITQSPSSQTVGKGGEYRRAAYTRSWSSGGVGSAGGQSPATLASQSTPLAGSAARRPVVPKKIDGTASRIAAFGKRVTPQREAGRGTERSGPKKVGKGGSMTCPEQQALPPPPLPLCRSSTFEKLANVGADTSQLPTAAPSGGVVIKTPATQTSSTAQTPCPSACRPAVRPTGLWKSSNKPPTSDLPGTGRRTGKTAEPVVSPSLLQNGKGGRRLSAGLKSPSCQIPGLQSSHSQSADGGSSSRGLSPASAIVPPFSYKPRTPTTPSGTRSLIPAPVKLAT